MSGPLYHCPLDGSRTVALTGVTYDLDTSAAGIVSLAEGWCSRCASLVLIAPSAEAVEMAVQAADRTGQDARKAANKRAGTQWEQAHAGAEERARQRQATAGPLRGKAGSSAAGAAEERVRELMSQLHIDAGQAARVAEASARLGIPADAVWHAMQQREAVERMASAPKRPLELKVFPRPAAAGG